MLLLRRYMSNCQLNQVAIDFHPCKLKKISNQKCCVFKVRQYIYTQQHQKVVTSLNDELLVEDSQSGVNTFHLQVPVTGEREREREGRQASARSPAQ